MVRLTQVASSIPIGKVASVSCTTNTGATCSVRDFSSSDNIFGVAFRYTPEGGTQLEAQLSGTYTFDASTEVPTFALTLLLQALAFAATFGCSSVCLSLRARERYDLSSPGRAGPPMEMETGLSSSVV